MKSAIGTALVLFLICLLGCPTAAPITESYSVETTPNELVAGTKQQIEMVIRYQRSRQAAAKLKYQIRFSAPVDLTLTPDKWDVEQDLSTNDAGFNYTGLISIEVAAEAPPGEREVKVTIMPAEGVATTETLILRVKRD